MKDSRLFCHEATEFVKKFFKIYFEERNFALLPTYFHKDISWFGTGAHEICRNYADGMRLLEAEKTSWDGRFKILEEWYAAAPIDENFCLVTGGIKIIEDGLNTLLLDMDSRFSIICHLENGEAKLYHVHFSVPNSGQTEDEFTHKALVADYNLKLERKLHERTKLLKDKTIELETLANNIYGGVQICRYDDDFTIMYASDGFLELTGYTREEVSQILHEKHVALMHPEDVKRVKAQIGQQLWTSNSFSVEYRIKTKDGKLAWVLDKGSRIPAVDGKDDCAKVQCILTDITMQKQQEQILAQDRLQLENVTNSIQAAIVRCDFDDKFGITYVNDGFYRMIGYTREQFETERDNSISAIIYDDDATEVRKSLAEQLREGNNTDNVHRLVRRDNTIIWVLVKGTIVTREDNTKEFQGILTDITEQKEVELALRFSEKRYEIALEASNVTMFEYDVVTKDLILLQNDATMFNTTSLIHNGPETLISSGIIEPNSVADFREMYSRIDAGEPFAQCFANAKDVSGAIHDYQFSITNVFDNKGKPLRAIGVRKNVTHMRQLEKENEFGKTMLSDKSFAFEADITDDELINVNCEWLESIGATGFDSFTEMIKKLCDNSVSREYGKIVGQKMSKEYIRDAFERGEKLLSFAYRLSNMPENQSWVEATVNIIMEQGNIIIRYYTSDISDRKQKEEKLTEERRRYESMISKTTIIYEVNITRNLFVSGHENWGELFGFKHSNNYTEMMKRLGEKAIHPDELEGFNAIFLRENVLDAYAGGTDELVYEYRRPDESGKFIWVECTMHLFEDPQTGDLRGHAYIENIEEKKQKELELIYRSEHDLLTGAYNKAASEKYITEFLATSEGKSGKHAFFFIDIDYFKSMNDVFGHAFGDAILSQVSAKITELFRDIDVVGRIGGDEFIILLKNIPNQRTATTKATEICRKVCDSFTKNGEVYEISASVGIAFYSMHGMTYEQLYKNSDTALYTSKVNGRNQFTIYSDNMVPMDSCANEIDMREQLEPKIFEKNIVEYVFRILYESDEKISAINSVLALVGKHYNTGRAYIFEDTADKGMSNTFEWCAQGISPQLGKPKNLGFTQDLTYSKNFDSTGIFFVKDATELDDDVRVVLEAQNVKSMLQFAIHKNGVFKGFIGFDECACIRIPTKKEVAELQSISNILGMFISEMRYNDDSNRMRTVAMSIINGLDSYAYVCNPDTYKVLFANEKTLETMPDAVVGNYCYKVLWGADSPCKVCPMRTMVTGNHKKYSMDISDHTLAKWVRSTASWVEWTNGEQMCLIDIVDITGYIKDRGHR